MFEKSAQKLSETEPVSSFRPQSSFVISHNLIITTKKAYSTYLVVYPA